MINNAKANEQANLDMVRTTQTEAFDKHFSNGLYWEVYEEQEKVLNKAFNKIFEKELRGAKNYQFSCLTKNEYYKDSLKKLYNGQLTVDQILANPKDHIWKMKFLILAGESQTYKNSEHDPSDVPLQCRFSDFNDKYRATGLHDMENWLVTCDNLMQSKNEAMSLKEDPTCYVLNNANLATLYVGNLDGTDFTDTNVSSVKR